MTTYEWRDERPTQRLPLRDDEGKLNFQLAPLFAGEVPINTEAQMCLFRRHEAAEVVVAKHCDICKHHYPRSTPDLAFADAATPMGWAWVCLAHFMEYNCRLGEGRGQVCLFDTRRLDAVVD